MANNLRFWIPRLTDDWKQLDEDFDLNYPSSYDGIGEPQFGSCRICNSPTRWEDSLDWPGATGNFDAYCDDCWHFASNCTLRPVLSSSVSCQPSVIIPPTVVARCMELFGAFA